MAHVHVQEEGLVAGIRGVEWDAVELPSQFMENWSDSARSCTAWHGLAHGARSMVCTAHAWPSVALVSGLSVRGGGM